MTSAASSSLPSGSVLSSRISGAAPLRAPLSNAAALLALAFATRVGADPGETTRYYYEPQPVAQPQASTGGVQGIDNTALGVLVTVPVLIAIAAIAYCACKRICCFSRPPSNAQTQLANLPVGQPVASHLPVMAPPPQAVPQYSAGFPPPGPPSKLGQEGSFVQTMEQFQPSYPTQPSASAAGPSEPQQGGVSGRVAQVTDAAMAGVGMVKEKWANLTPEEKAKAKRNAALVAAGGITAVLCCGAQGDAADVFPVSGAGAANLDEISHIADLTAQAGAGGGVGPLGSTYNIAA